MTPRMEALRAEQEAQRHRIINFVLGAVGVFGAGYLLAWYVQAFMTALTGGGPW